MTTLMNLSTKGLQEKSGVYFYFRIRVITHRSMLVEKEKAKGYKHDSKEYASMSESVFLNSRIARCPS